MRPPRPSPVYCTIAVLSWPFIRLLFRLRAKGLENVPSGGGFVLAANHISNLDPWALGMPFFIAGGVKTAYDIALFMWFRSVPLHQEDEPTPEL